MKKFLFYALSLAWLAMSSCQKEFSAPIKPPTPDDLSKIEIVWQYPSTPDTTPRGAYIHDVRAGKLLCRLTRPGSTELQMRNAQTGAFIWKFSGFLSPMADFNLISDIFVCDNNILMAEDKGDVHAIDYTLEGGDLLWASVGTSQPFGSNQLGDYLYTVQSTGCNFDIKASSIVRTRAQREFSGWDTLYTRVAVKDSFPLMNFPVLWVNREGDSILVFNESQGYNGDSPSPQRNSNFLTAFNMKSRKVMWQYPKFKGSYNAPPLIDGDRLYISAGVVFFFDLNSGRLLWSRNRLSGPPVVYNDILIVPSGNPGIVALNKYTGEPVWEQKEIIPLTSQLALFDGIVYFISVQGRMRALNAETGEPLWNERSPNYGHFKTPNAGFSYSGIAIDPEKGMLYTADNYFVMCIKLPQKY